MVLPWKDTKTNDKINKKKHQALNLSISNQSKTAKQQKYKRSKLQRKNIPFQTQDKIFLFQILKFLNHSYTTSPQTQVTNVHFRICGVKHARIKAYTQFGHSAQVTFPKTDVPKTRSIHQEINHTRLIKASKHRQLVNCSK